MQNQSPITEFAGHDRFQTGRLPQYMPFRAWGGSIALGSLWLCLLAVMSVAGAQAPLVADGAIRAVLVVSDDLRADFPAIHGHRNGDQDFTATAADELREHLGLLGEGEVTVRETAAAAALETARELRAAGKTPIVLGGPSTDADLTAAIEARGEFAESFALRVDDGIVTIVGLSPKGALNGVYEVLEQMGFRWFMPGDIGRVVPAGTDFSLPAQQTVQVPSFDARWLHGANVAGHDAWQRRTRQGGFFVPPAHGGVPRDVTDEEAIGEIAGRILNRLRDRDPEQTDPLTVGIGPPDRPRWFEDNEASLALDAGDYDPFLGSVSRTDRLMWHYNQILKQVDQEIPNANVRLMFYAYHSYFRPPVRKRDVDPRIVPAFAPITLCRVHGMGQAICPEKMYYQDLMKGWSEAVPVIYKRGYYFNLACPGIPFSMVHRLRHEIPIAHDLGLTGFRQEIITKWGSETPSLYVAARLMWDHETDVDALLADFYVKFFGPAAEPMRAYLEMMDAALRDTDHHAGCSFDVIQWYPTELRARANTLLNAALEATGDDIYGERVRIFRQTFDFMEALVHMLKYRAAHHYVAAQTELDRMRALMDTLFAYDPPMLHPRYSPGYLDRFFSVATEQGVARVTDGNQLLAGLDNVWKFRIDPEDEGEAAGWYREDFEIDEKDLAGEVGYGQPDARDVAAAGRGTVSDVTLLVDEPWQRVRSSTITWDTLGLRYYKERPAWYLQSVRIPEEAAGETVYLWFGGVDDQARVWVNGHEVGTGRGAFRPFEFDVSEVIRPGRDNRVAVQVINRGLSELGTGGLMAPVMFYARETDLEIDPGIEFPEFPLY